MSEDFIAAARQMTPEIYDNLKRALELGKWPDGRPLAAEQKDICMQAIIAYEEANIPQEQRTGFMSQSCSSEKGSADEMRPLNDPS